MDTRLQLEVRLQTAFEEEAMFWVTNTTGSRPGDAPRSKRAATIVAGTLILVAAISGYQLYFGLLTENPTELDSVQRLEIVDFKLMYDRWMAIKADLRGHDQAHGVDKGSFYLIDVRSSVAYADGHIPGAISIPEPELADRVRLTIPPALSDAVIVLYCT